MRDIPIITGKKDFEKLDGIMDTAMQLCFDEFGEEWGKENIVLIARIKGKNGESMVNVRGTPGGAIATLANISTWLKRMQNGEEEPLRKVLHQAVDHGFDLPEQAIRRETAPL